MKRTVFITGEWDNRHRMSWRNGYLSLETDIRSGWFDGAGYVSHHVINGKNLRVIVASYGARIPYALALQIATAYSMNLYDFKTIDLTK